MFLVLVLFHVTKMESFVSCLLFSFCAKHCELLGATSLVRYILFVILFT
jgi:hypothetical protein